MLAHAQRVRGVQHLQRGQLGGHIADGECDLLALRQERIDGAGAGREHGSLLVRALRCVEGGKRDEAGADALGDRGNLREQLLGRVVGDDAEAGEVAHAGGGVHEFQPFRQRADPDFLAGDADIRRVNVEDGAKPAVSWERGRPCRGTGRGVELEGLFGDGLAVDIQHAHTRGQFLAALIAHQHADGGALGREKDAGALRGPEPGARHQRDGNIVKVRRADNVLVRHEVLADRLGCERLELFGLEKFEVDLEPRRGGGTAGDQNLNRLPSAGREHGRGADLRAGNGIGVLIQQARGEERAGVLEARGLHLGADGVVRVGEDGNFAGFEAERGGAAHGREFHARLAGCGK